MFAASPSMARPHDGRARDCGPGPRPNLTRISHAAVSGNDNHRLGPSYSSALSSDALAVIEPIPIAVNQSGRTPVGIWRLRFAERWSPRPRSADRTWTGGGDPLAQNELRDPDVEAAERYCDALASVSKFVTRGIPRRLAKCCHGCAAAPPVPMRWAVEQPEQSGQRFPPRSSQVRGRTEPRGRLGSASSIPI